MKLFISWSGEYSKAIATALKDWLGLVFPGISTFLSTDDIRKGQRWRVEITKALEQCNFGIVCLTPDNLNAPWLLYESGALSKSLANAQLFTLLFHLKQSDIVGPLEDFQHTLFNKEEFYKLISNLNEAQGQTKHAESNLKKLYEMFFDEFDKKIKAANGLKKKQPSPPKRDLEEILEQLLETTNYIARNIPSEKKLLEQLANPPAFEADPFTRAAVAPNDFAIAAVDLGDEGLEEVLKNHGITSLAQLAACTPKTLRKFGLSNESIGELKKVLFRFGYKAMPFGAKTERAKQLLGPWEKL